MASSRRTLVVMILIVSMVSSPALAGWRFGWKNEVIGVSINDKGDLTFSAGITIPILFVGTFSFSYDYSIHTRESKDYTYIVVRNGIERNDKVYKLRTGDEPLTLEIQYAHIHARDRYIIIDITEGISLRDKVYSLNDELFRLKAAHGAELASVRKNAQVEKTMAHAEGMRQGHESGRKSGLAEGRAEGEAVGFDKGYTQGMKEGNLTVVWKSGQAVGKIQGEMSGFERGKQVGYEDGFAKGVEEGRRIQKQYDTELAYARSVADSRDPVWLKETPTWNDIRNAIAAKEASDRLSYTRVVSGGYGNPPKVYTYTWNDRTKGYTRSVK